MKTLTKNHLLFLILFGFLSGMVVTISCSAQKNSEKNEEGWINLFDGKTLDGWKASESQTSFRVEDGAILAQGPRSHLYYMGPVMNHDFKNFEFKTKVKTKEGANSGIYFHTKFQQEGYPDNGFEVQVNNSGEDWRRTGCLYDIVDFGEQYAKDNEWFTIYIRVEGKNVVVKVDDKKVIDWTQPEDYVIPEGHPGRIISSGTFAFQEHDPHSVTWYKDIMVRPLP